MKTLKLLITTDLHGAIFPTDYSNREAFKPYGLAKISTAIQQFRDASDHFILIDNGDSYQGTPLLTMAHQQADRIENPMVDAFNLLHYDLLNLGNHDFNYGAAILRNFISRTQADVLTENVLIEGVPAGKTRIIEIGSRRIAFIGVCTHYIPNWEQPANLENITFADAYTTLETALAAVRDQVDLVIGLYHGGFERDLEHGQPTEALTGENQGYAMSSLEGLDILITGHQHRSLTGRMNGTLVTQSTFKGQEFATIDIDLETLETSAQLHQAADFAADTAFLEHFETLNQQTQDWLDEPIGSMRDGDLFVSDTLDARIHKHTLVSFINQVQRDVTGADFATTALFNDIGGFNQQITMRDLVNTYIYPNTLVVKKMSGKAIKDMLEFSARYFTLDENGKITVSPEFVSPKPQHYNYEMLEPLDYTIHAGAPQGERIEINDTDFDETKTYTVVMNNYRASGGGNFTMVREAETVQEIQRDMIDILMEYFRNHSPVVIDHHENIKVIA